MNYVDTVRSHLGAIMQQLQTLENADQTEQTNLSNAESNIRDINVAQAMTKYQQHNILQQAATAMLAQANTQPQNLLTLFR